MQCEIFQVQGGRWELVGTNDRQPAVALAKEVRTTPELGKRPDRIQFDSQRGTFRHRSRKDMVARLLDSLHQALFSHPQP